MGESDCPWWGWGTQAGGAEIWDLAGMRVVAHYGSDSGLWTVDGGSVKPDAQPAGCGAPTPSLLSKIIKEE